MPRSEPPRPLLTPSVPSHAGDVRRARLQAVAGAKASLGPVLPPGHPQPMITAWKQDRVARSATGEPESGELREAVT